MQPSLYLLVLLLTFNSFASSASSEIVSKLESDTRSLKVDIGVLQKKADSFKNRLEVLNERLAIPSHIAHDLGELDKSMGDVKSVASVGKLAPPIKSQSELVVEGIEVTNPPVHDSRVMMEKLAEAIEPIRDEIKKAIKKIEETQSKVNTFKKKKLTPFYNSVVSAQQCVDKAKPTHLSCMQKKLDGLSSKADSVVSTTDSGLKSLISVIDSIEGTIDKLESEIKAIEKLIDGINLLEHDLSKIVNPFSLLHALFKKRFHISFPYPNPKNLLKKAHFKISLSGKEIIKGIKKIEKKIKDMIKGALYKAAKLFGLKKLAKKLFNLFDHPFKILMKKFHLKFKVKLPGLKKLKGLDLRLNPLFKDMRLGFKKLDLKLNLPKMTACGQLSKGCK